MKNKLSREDFLTLSEELHEDGPQVKYQNPDAWINYILKHKPTEKIEKENSKEQP